MEKRDDVLTVTDVSFKRLRSLEEIISEKYAPQQHKQPCVNGNRCSSYPQYIDESSNNTMRGGNAVESQQEQVMIGRGEKATTTTPTGRPYMLCSGANNTIPLSSRRDLLKLIARTHFAGNESKYLHEIPRK